MYRIVLLALLAASLTGCHFYKLTVQQGNIITEADVQKLHIGMNKAQVIHAIGKPVLENPFENHRWYYIHTYQKGYGGLHKKRLVLYFRGNVLEKIVRKHH